jgi:neutral amino acid transport system permease protein
LLDYLVSIVLTAGIYAIFALGLNLQWGYAGLLNFGHVSFMALGAYTTVLLGMHGVPLPLAVLAGMLLAGASGAFLGMATLRLREDYLAIVTIGFSEIIRFLLLNWSSLTKGSFGLFGYPRPGENLVGAMDYNLFLACLVIGVLHWSMPFSSFWPDRHGAGSSNPSGTMRRSLWPWARTHFTIRCSAWPWDRP